MSIKYIGINPDTSLRIQEYYPKFHNPVPTDPISISVVPAAYVGRDELENGNRIILCPSVLLKYEIILEKCHLSQPLVFAIQNALTGKSTNVGVMDFTAESDVCIVPNWLFEGLGFDLESEAHIMLLPGVPKATKVILKPHKSQFVEIGDTKELLEKCLSKFVALTTGETIVLKVDEKPFYFDVSVLLSLKQYTKATFPDGHYKCVNLIDTDVEIEFEPALDEEKKKTPNMLVYEAVPNSAIEENTQKSDKKSFQGMGTKLNGEKIEEEVIEDEYDPKKRRIFYIKLDSQKYHGEGLVLKLGSE